MISHHFVRFASMPDRDAFVAKLEKTQLVRTYEKAEYEPVVVLYDVTTEAYPILEKLALESSLEKPEFFADIPFEPLGG